jgi:hypothetical protein
MHDDRTTPTPDGRDAGYSEMDLPGPDRPDPRPDRDDELPEHLGERIDQEPDGIASGEPDLLPNVEVPEAQM